MARKSKCKMVITGHDEILKQIESMGKNVEHALQEAIELSGKRATMEYKIIIQQHHLSGLTEKSIVSDIKARIEGKKVILETGFDIKKGGAPAIWLDRGTPTEKPINFVRRIKKNKGVKSAIDEVLEKSWRKSL